MTTNHHTPIPSSPKQPANAETFNVPLSELDTKITNHESRIVTLEGEFPPAPGNPTEFLNGSGGWTVPAGTGASIDGHVIKDEGVSLPQRASVDFVGAGVTVTNEVGGTQVSISGGVTDHGALTGLNDDDHVQYLQKTGLSEWDEQSGDPPVPSMGKWKIYFKATGLYLIDDAGNVVGPIDVANSIVLSPASPRVYTGNNTWTKPTGLHHIIVEVIGGGGAGGGAIATDASSYSAGGGGGGGGYSKKRIDAAALGATETITVGAGGAAVSGANGNGGNTSSFGTHLQATGGEGGGAIGAFASSGIGGASLGGAGSLGDINSYGDVGGFGARNIGGTGVGGNGGGTTYGGGAKGIITVSGIAGSAGNNYGGGGSGAVNCLNQAARAGGAGAGGVVIIWEYMEA